MNLCHEHFEAFTSLGEHPSWDEQKAVAAACPACRRVDWKQREYTQTHCTIVQWRPYGAHIPLTCEAHPKLTWHTKNIDHIGARSIFYSTRNVPECACDARLLRPVDLSDRLMFALEVVNRTAPPVGPYQVDSFLLGVSRALFALAWEAA